MKNIILISIILLFNQPEAKSGICSKIKGTVKSYDMKSVQLSSASAGEIRLKTSQLSQKQKLFFQKNVTKEFSGCIDIKAFVSKIPLQKSGH